LVVATIMLTTFPFFVRPFSDNHPSPQPFTFFVLPETSTVSEPFVPILVAVLLPSEISKHYQLSDFFVISESLFVPTFPLLEEPFFDSETNSFVWLFAGLFEVPENIQPMTISLFAFASFRPSNPSLPFLSSFNQATFSVSPSSYAVEPVELTGCPEVCIWEFGIECTCPWPNDGTIPPDSGTSPPDEDDGEPPCSGISYMTPSPQLGGFIVEPAEGEVIVIAGDTLTLRANGSPDPDVDQTISRAFDPESGSCSSSERFIPGSPLSFTWRLWKDENGDGYPETLLRVIGYGREISWQAPMEAGVYWIELVIDDDFNPDLDAYPQKLECEKCTIYSNSDDPAVRDWVKVIVNGYIRLLSSYPHHIVYRRPPEPILPPEEEEVIGPEFGDPVVFDIFDEGEDHEPDVEEGEEVEEVEVPAQEPTEQYVPLVTINPTPNPQLDHPTISFSVEVIGYELWQATIIIYPVGSEQPIATYRRIYPSNQTFVTVSWDDIFPNEKPPTGVYTYDIVVEGISFPSPATLSPKASNKDDRLSKHASILKFQVTPQLDPQIGLVKLSMKFQVLNENGTEPSVENARVELRNFKNETVATINLQRVVQDGQVWWQGNYDFVLDAPDKLGLWRLVACADVKEGSKMKVVREVERKLEIRIQVSDVALGFRVWRGQQIVTEEMERRYPYAGDQVLFRCFLRVVWEIGRQRKESWYSSNPVQRAELSHYSWIGMLSNRPQEDVFQLPEGLLNILEPKVTWRRFYNIVVRNIQCGRSGQHRWYGMRCEDVGEGFIYRWEAEVGTSWWGAKVEWQVQEKGANGNAVRCRMAFLYPTNQREGRHLVRLDRLNFNRGYNNQLIWTPNPWEVRDRNSNDIRDVIFGGRISARLRWVPEEITFDDNDPFFAKHPDRNRQRQAILHSRILEWAYSFLNVPYSWDGRSYGGRQSVNDGEYTCSNRSGCNRAGIRHGIDCAEFVSIAAQFGGRTGNLPRYTGGLASTNLAENLSSWRYVRPGDFAVAPGRHVVYAIDRPVMSGEKVISLLTIEAGGDIPVPGVNTRGIVRVWQRTERDRTPIHEYLPRRWIEP